MQNASEYIPDKGKNTLCESLMQYINFMKAYHYTNIAINESIPWYRLLQLRAKLRPINQIHGRPLHILCLGVPAHSIMEYIEFELEI